MKLRFGELHNGGFYHVFNRGVDKRDIFQCKEDVTKFKKMLEYCNTEKPIKSIRDLLEGNFEEKFDSTQPLVRVHAYACMGNHYHLLLEQVSENGVSEYMKRVGGGYTRSFNHHNQRTGSLFGGAFKYIQCKSDNQVLRLCAYINLNYLVHQQDPKNTIIETSHEHYIKANSKSFVTKKMCLDLFGGVDGYIRKASIIVDDVVDQRSINDRKSEYGE